MISSLAAAYPHLLRRTAASRPWIVSVDPRDTTQIVAALRREEDEQRMLDEAYWRPLKQKLEQLRMARGSRRSEK